MIAPVQQGDVLLRDICDADPGAGFCLWWLGQSGFLIKSAAGVLLFDPYLSDSLTAKYAATDKPHERMTAIPIAPRSLDMVDWVTSSHNHTDHLDAETLGPLIDANAALQMIIPAANRQFVSDRLACAPDWPIGLRDGQSIEAGGFVFHGIAAAHNDIERDEHGNPRCMGFVATFDGHSVYHSGDTLWHDELVNQLAPFDIDVALLPINGKLPHRRVAGNLWGQEAAELANQVGATCVVPCHYEMFTFNTESPHAFEARCQQLGQPFRTLKCGERFDFDSGSAF